MFAEVHDAVIEYHFSATSVSQSAWNFNIHLFREALLVRPIYYNYNYSFSPS